MTAADLGRGIAAGEISPVALTETFLDAIRGHQHRDRIYARLTESRALAEAAAAHDRAKAGLRRGLLDGVPLSWKDLFDTAGVATEAGSALLAGRMPHRDARVLRNATAAGLICLGKTHMSELAFSGLGLNPITATPPCINDAAAVPGGSSSGAAASVAFGLAPAAIGSDTGGSVRIPAAWNDLVGLKTTAGRVSAEGVVPLVESFDTVGPLTRSVEDAALLLAVLEGGKPADLRGAQLKGARLMVLETTALEHLRDAPRRGFEMAVAALRDAGALVEARPVPEVDEALVLSAALFNAEANAIWRDTIAAAPEKMFARIRERFDSGAAISGPDHVAAWRRMRVLRAIWAERVAGYDAVLLPTSAILPPEVDRLMTDADYYVTENLLTLRNTRIGNLFGLCALTLPTGVSSTGLMLMGAPFGEERLLRLGAAAEAALGVRRKSHNPG
ncbi:MAG: amidase [Rhodobacteraceae bacterium]|nr:amidase [Paracoccaceae bacterium]